MRWSNIRVIFGRELRDQIRDRRTLFMIFVLPILLYPVLGLGSVQLSAAFEQKTRHVVVVGPDYLPPNPPLLNASGDGFDPSLFDSPEEARRLVVKTVPAEGDWRVPERIRAAIQEGLADAVVVLPPDLRQNLDSIRGSEPPIEYDSTDEASQITYRRVKEVLDRWSDKIVDIRLKKNQLPPSYTRPFHIKAIDVAAKEKQGGTIWSRIFPFLLVMMSLNGAFYPAVDLCAGEKERGTMETLLISPASRGEIVVGKFLTVVLASMTSALLNILGMGLTGMQLASQLSALNPQGGAQQTIIAAPTLSQGFWMLVLLIPLSVFFSAICVALAVLARSMKEGQYYVTPLYLITLPLVLLTLGPEIELNLFYCLIPITGVSLLLRALILGDYAVAWRYFLPVMMTTVLYGAVALRWAVDQFHREDVLFREAERFDLRSWARHLLRDKEPLPTGGEAIFCFSLMITLAWFLMNYLAGAGLGTRPAAMAAGQIAFILTPPLAMAFIITSSPRRTLRLYWPRGRYLALAIALVLTLNPLVNELGHLVTWLFPMSEVIRTAFERMVAEVPSLPVAVLLFALVPAVCEELAFRGFILSGLERGHRTWSAIVLSAILFGFLHVLMSLYQQLFNATLLGLVLGLLAVRSRSIVPGMVFHLINNALGVSLQPLLNSAAGRAVTPWLFRNPAEGLYYPVWLAAGAAISAYLIYMLWREGKSDRAEEVPGGSTSFAAT
jgi:sodium transport system permease protein